MMPALLSRFSRVLFALLGMAALFTVILPNSARAQLGGENVRGDVGLKSGSQAPPGWYVGDMFYFYNPDKIVLANGDSVSGPSLNLFGNFFLFTYVSKKKIFGANYGFLVAPAVLNARLALPTLDVSTSTWGLADMYIQPFQLGWHFKQADAIVGYAFFAPIGRYSPTAKDNTGLGMWSNEFSAGTTVYFDASRKWHAAATGYYEIHSSKRDLDEKVGNMFTLEGGVGRAFAQGYANVGMAYFGQWKVTDDSGTDVPLLAQGVKGSMFGLGPEINMPLGKRPVFLTFRYLFDVHSRQSTQGQSLILSVVWAHPAKPDAPAKSACSAQPTEVLRGEPLTVRADAANFDPTHALAYRWSTNGGTISSSESTGIIETGRVAAGTYIAIARVSDPRKKDVEAECSAKFTVKDIATTSQISSAWANRWVKPALNDDSNALAGDAAK